MKPNTASLPQWRRADLKKSEWSSGQFAVTAVHCGKAEDQDVNIV